MNNKTLIILIFISFFATGIIPIFAFVFIGLLIYYFVKNKDQIKQNNINRKEAKSQVKKQKRLYNYYLTVEGREALKELIDYYELECNSEEDYQSTAKYFSSVEGQKAIDDYLMIQRNKNIEEIDE